MNVYFKNVCINDFITPMLSFVIISVNYTRNTLTFIMVEEYVINEGCRFLIYSREKGYSGMKLFVNKTSKN